MHEARVVCWQTSTGTCASRRQFLNERKFHCFSNVWKKLAGKTLTESAKYNLMGSINHSKHMLANYTHHVSHCSYVKILGGSQHAGSCNKHSAYSGRAYIEVPAPPCLKTGCTCKIGLPYAFSSLHVFCLFKSSQGFRTTLNAMKWCYPRQVLGQWIIKEGGGQYYCLNESDIACVTDFLCISITI